MLTSSTITRQEKSSVKLSVKVAKDEVNAEYSKLLNSYAKDVQIKGFRKGKVPRDVLEVKFGEALKGEALGKIIDIAIQEILEDEKFDRANYPLAWSRPVLQNEADLKLDLNADLNFEVVWDVFPEVSLGDYKGLDVEVPVVAVEEADIKREIEDIRQRNAIIIDKDDKAKAAKDDVITINYSELDEKNEVIEGTEREDFVFTLGSGQNLYKLDDDIIGMKKGQSKDIKKEFPADFADSDLAGTTKTIRVSLTQLKAKKLPDLDDEFAQDVSEKYKNLEDLRADVTSKLNATLEDKLREIRVNNFLAAYMDSCKVELPESMIAMELDTRWRNMARQFNLPLERLGQLFAASGKNPDDIMNEMRPEVEKSLTSRIIVEKLIEEKKLSVSEEEKEAELTAISEKAAASIEDVRKYYEQDQMLQYLESELKERKLFDAIFSEIKIKKGKKVKYLDLVAQNG